MGLQAGKGFPLLNNGHPVCRRVLDGNFRLHVHRGCIFEASLFREHLISKWYFWEMLSQLGLHQVFAKAVCRDELNPSSWCSIGVLYYQINQFRDALDAYSRSICLNPQQSEVWYDLGTLYESCTQLSG